MKVKGEVVPRFGHVKQISLVDYSTWVLNTQPHPSHCHASPSVWWELLYFKKLANVLSTRKATWKWFVYYKLHSGYILAFLKVGFFRVSISMLELWNSKTFWNHPVPKIDLVVCAEVDRLTSVYWSSVLRNILRLLLGLRVHCDRWAKLVIRAGCKVTRRMHVSAILFEV